MGRRSKRAFAFVCLSALLGAPLDAETVPAVLARMDKEAAQFRQMTAKLKRITFTAMPGDNMTEEESGTIWLKRSGRDVRMRVEITGAGERSVGFRDSKAEIYYPKMKMVQVYDLGKERSLVDQFLLLGFGSSGKDLEKSYTVKMGGEQVLGGRKTTRLELVPKSKQAQEQIKLVELRVPVDAGYPVQQKFLQPGGDYYLVVYSDIKLNPGLPDSDFNLKLPAGVKVEHPQR